MVPKVLTVPDRRPRESGHIVIKAVRVRSTISACLVQLGRSFALTITPISPYLSWSSVLSGISHLAAEKPACRKVLPLAVLPHSKLLA